MTAAERNKMLNDMKNAIALETDIAAQRQLMECCGKTMQEKCPVFVPLEEPVLSTPPVSVPEKVYYMLIFFSFVFLIVGVCACKGVPFLLLFGIGVGLLLVALHIKKKNRSQLEDYQLKIEKRKADNHHKKEIYERQYRDWEASKQAILQSIQAQTQKSIALRDAFYAQENFLYAKYLTLPALTSIYEYFLTGRCDELTGPHGAYNLYEDEVRKDTVIEKLNVVIENLEQIKQSQYLLYQQVKAIQQTTNAIAQELVQIKGYTIALTQLSALNAYYARLNERNTRISMYYHLAS